MTARILSSAVAFLLAVFSASPVVPSAADEDLSQLADYFGERGLERLPGQESMLVEGGVVGVLPGAPLESETKPYVLITASQPEGAAAVEAFVKLGTGGADELDGHPIQGLLTSFERHVIVALWKDADAAGEEVIPLDRIAAYLDLAGPTVVADEPVRITGAGSSPVWKRLVEQSNIPVGLNIEIVEAPDLGSLRAMKYYGREIPGLQLAVGTPAPGTDAGFAGSTLAALIAVKMSRLAEPPAFQRVEQGKEDGKPTTKRPYTGTIPDYADDVEGLRLGGVLEGGPAEEAGLREGDVIVELAGQPIKDVYSYAEILDRLEVDVPVAVVVVRDGERIETTMTPRGR